MPGDDHDAPDEQRQRAALLDAARRVNDLGINQGKSGNLSVRLGGGFVITPSAVPYGGMEARDLVRVQDDGTFTATEGRVPSSEWRLHRDLYRHRPEAGAVVHAHSMFATTLSCLGRDIPAFHYMIAVAGGNDIRCAPYATFGTQALSDHALRALAGRRACLHGHHGMTVFAGTVADALALAVEVETLAAMYWRALQVGVPRTLDDEEMRIVLQKFERYGKPPDGPSPPARDGTEQDQSSSSGSAPEPG